MQLLGLPPEGDRRRGAALLMVLWTFAVIAVLAGEFARAMRQEAQSTLNFKQETIAHYTAIAGLNEALLAIVTYNGQLASEESTATGNRRLDEENVSLSKIRTLLAGRGRWVHARFDSKDYQVRVFDESGKISLNSEALDESNLDAMLKNLGFDDESASIVADSILDWRDDNDLHRPNGAEDDYYQGLDTPYPAKDAPFDAVEELLFVRGVTRRAFYGADGYPGLREVFTTVHSSSRVNVSAVPEAVEIALCGERFLKDDEKEDAFGAKDEERVYDLQTCLSDLGLPVRRTGARTRARLNQALVEARVVERASGTTARPRTVSHVAASVSFTEDGFQVLRWYDSLFAEDLR
jgi:type II secretory pathway component PulK